MCGFLASSVNNTADSTPVTLYDTDCNTNKTKLAYEEISKINGQTLSSNTKSRIETIIKSMDSIKDAEIFAFSENQKCLVSLSLDGQTQLSESEESAIKEIVTEVYPTILSADIIIQYS